MAEIKAPEPKAREESPMQIKYLQVLVMPNGEILCAGLSIGWADNQRGDKVLGDYLFTKDGVASARE